MSCEDYLLESAYEDKYALSEDDMLIENELTCDDFENCCDCPEYENCEDAV